MSRQNRPQDINDPKYWKTRLEKAINKNKIHEAIFLCSLSRWQQIEETHKKILSNVILPNESILDVGCGWGRLLDLMPSGWAGDYLGIDLSPDFVNLANERHPDKTFIVGSAEEIIPVVAASPSNFIGPDLKFDWCVVISMRPMIINNQGQQAWDNLQQLIFSICNRILFLEYVENDTGNVEYPK